MSSPRRLVAPECDAQRLQVSPNVSLDGASLRGGHATTRSKRSLKAVRLAPRWSARSLEAARSSIARAVSRSWPGVAPLAIEGRSAPGGFSASEPRPAASSVSSIQVLDPMTVRALSEMSLTIVDAGRQAKAAPAVYLVNLCPGKIGGATRSVQVGVGGGWGRPALWGGGGRRAGRRSCGITPISGGR